MSSSTHREEHAAERLAITAIAGLVAGLSGCAARAPEAVVAIPTPEGTGARPEPPPIEARHARAERVQGSDRACCRGLNDCKGKGNCRVQGVHECRGLNDCKGKGGCESPCDASAEPREPKACCKGQNQCKGLGQCKTSDNACKGQNACKARGGCRPADCGP